MPSLDLRGYYAILDVPPAALPDHDALLARAAVRLAARPCCVQLRAKGAPAEAFARAALALGALCRERGVPLCVNDRLDVALLAGAELVHLGQDDLPLADARRIGGGRLRIGISTHDLSQARAAAAAGADYVGFGPVFGTATKANPGAAVGLAALREVCAAVHVPVVAIGGVTIATAAAIARAGAAAAAVVAAVDQAADPGAAGRAIAAAFQ